MSERTKIGDLCITKDPHGFIIGPRVHSLVDNPCVLITRDDPSYREWSMFFMLLSELEESKEAMTRPAEVKIPVGAGSWMAR